MRRPWLLLCLVLVVSGMVAVATDTASAVAPHASSGVGHHASTHSAPPLPPTRPCTRIKVGAATPWSSFKRDRDDRPCGRLPSPKGAVIMPVGYVRGEPIFSIRDNTNKVLCNYGPEPEYRACHLDGVAPFRLVFGGTYFTGPIRLTFLRLDKPRGCSYFPGGAFGTAAGATVKFDPGHYARCLVIPAAEISTIDTLYRFQRLSGSGTMTARLTHVSGTTVPYSGNGVCSAGSSRTPPAEFGYGGFECTADQVGGYITIVAVGDGTTETWRLIRRPVVGDSSCRPFPAGSDGQVRASGGPNLYLAVDCWLLRADPADRFMIDLQSSTDDYVEGQVHMTEAPYRAPDFEYDVCEDSSSFYSCHMSGHSAYALIVSQDSPATPTPYRVVPFRYYSAGAGYDPSCRRDADPSIGFAPFVGRLDGDHPVLCVVAPEAPTGGGYHVDLGEVGNQQSGIQLDGCGYDDHLVDCPYATNPEGSSFALLFTRVSRTGSVPYVTAGSCLYGGDFSHPMPVAPGCRPPAVVNDVAPSIDGDPAVGATVRADDGTWLPGLDSATYQWLLDGAPIETATFYDFTPSPDMAGHRLSVRVTATRDFFATGSATSPEKTIG